MVLLQNRQNGERNLNTKIFNFIFDIAFVWNGPCSLFIFFNGIINFRLAWHTNPKSKYTPIYSTEKKKNEKKKITHNKNQRADLYICMLNGERKKIYR